MDNCSNCNYSCPRGAHSIYGMSADCNLICTYETDRDMYVSYRKTCKHYTVKGTPINWKEKRRREYPIVNIS